MGVQVTLKDIQSGFQSVSAINSNNALIEEALSKSLDRTSNTDNAMQVDLDMNSNRVLNLPEATSPLEPIRKQEFDIITAAFAALEDEVAAAEASATAAATSAANAAGSATTAEGHKDAAAASATAAQVAETASEAAQAAAETAEGNASTSETNAASSASQAATSASNALASETDAESALFDINSKFLGAAASSPATDLNGNALTTGSWYFNTVDNTSYVYSGTGFVSIASVDGTIAYATDATSGVVEFATSAEDVAGSRTDVASTPAGVSAYVASVTGTAAARNVGTGSSDLIEGSTFNSINPDVRSGVFDPTDYLTFDYFAPGLPTVVWSGSSTAVSRTLLSENGNGIYLVEIDNGLNDLMFSIYMSPTIESQGTMEYTGFEGLSLKFNGSSFSVVHYQNDGTYVGAKTIVRIKKL